MRNMRCFCTSNNTLNLFIRSVAHIDVVTLASARKQRSTRRLTSTTQTRFQSYETSLQHSSFQSPAAKIRDGNTEKWSRTPGIEVDHTARADDTESAFAELTPESIDAIARESDPQTAFRDGQDAESKKRLQDDIPDRPSRTTFRRTKV